MDTNASTIIGKNENAEYCCMSHMTLQFFQDKVDVIIVF